MNLKQKPSDKVQRRYVLIDSENKDKVEDLLKEYLGVLGFAKASPLFLKSKDGKIILAVLRKEVDNVRAGFEMSKEKIKIIRVSGTIDGLE